MSNRIRRCTLTIAALAIALLGTTRAATAQQQLTDDGQHLFRIGAAGGVVVPTSDARNALKQGVQGQAFVLVNLLPGMPLRFNLGYQRFDLAQAIGAATTPTIEGGSTRILSGVAGTQLDMLHGPVRPYITLGLGGFDVTRMMSAAAGAASGATDISQLKFGIDGGVGVALKIGRLDAFIEGHMQNVYTDRGLIDAKSIQAVPVSFGVLF